MAIVISDQLPMVGAGGLARAASVAPSPSDVTPDLGEAHPHSDDHRLLLRVVPRAHAPITALQADVGWAAGRRAL